MPDESYKLREAQRHIAELDSRIVRQRGEVEELARLGQETAEARQLLADMEALMQEFHRQRLEIERELADRAGPASG
jgi:hypothetical protein